MSIILSNIKTWISNKWITFKFFEDVLICYNRDNELTKEIKDSLKFNLDFLNINELADKNIYTEFKNIVDKVIEYNEKIQGQDMAAPEYYPVYKKKILELKQMLSEIE